MVASLSDVQSAGKYLFSVQEDKTSLIKWEEFGLRIGVNKNSFSLFKVAAQVAVIALVGGQFKFPENTVLVSAVYAVTVSKPLLKPLKLEIQHCVDLTCRPGLSKYLKFAIAPVSTAARASLPYQFRIIEGGDFGSDSWYATASIDTHGKEFSLFCVLGMTTAGDDEGRDEHVLTYAQLKKGEREQQQGKQAGGGRQRQQQQGQKLQQQSGKQAGGRQRQQEKEQKHREGELAQSPSPKKVSTGIKEATTYAGLIYYEKDLVTFTAAKKLNTLMKVSQMCAIMIFLFN